MTHWLMLLKDLRPSSENSSSNGNRCTPCCNSYLLPLPKHEDSWGCSSTTALALKGMIFQPITTQNHETANRRACFTLYSTIMCVHTCIKGDARRARICYRR